MKRASNLCVVALNTNLLKEHLVHLSSIYYSIWDFNCFIIKESQNTYLSQSSQAVRRKILPELRSMYYYGKLIFIHPSSTNVPQMINIKLHILLITHVNL